MPKFYDENDQELTGQDAEQAILQGNARADAGVVYLQNSAGDRVSFDVAKNAQQLADAVRDGYRIESPEETHHQQVAIQARHDTGTGLAEAGLRGATLGLSDVAGRAISPDYAERAGARREALGNLATVAEVAGGVAPLLATGGIALPAGAAGRATAFAGRAAAEALERRGVSAGVARLAGLAAEGTLDGTVQGIGQALSEQALGDSGYNAEQIASSGMIGALLGGAAGGGLGLVGMVAKRGAQKLSDKLVEKYSAKEGGALADAAGSALEHPGKADAGGWQALKDKAADLSAAVSGADAKSVKELWNDPNLRSDLLRQEEIRIQAGKAIRDPFQTVLDNSHLINDIGAGDTKLANLKRDIPRDAPTVAKARSESANMVAEIKRNYEDARDAFSPQGWEKVNKNLEFLESQITRGLGGAETGVLRNGLPVNRAADLPRVFRALEGIKRQQDLIRRVAKTGAKSDLAAGLESNVAADLAQKTGDDVRRFLEREDLWGAAGRKQRERNAAWHEFLNTSEGFDNQLISRTGEKLDDDYWWLKKRRLDGTKTDNFLKGVNDTRKEYDVQLVNAHMNAAEKLFRTVLEHGDVPEHLISKMEAAAKGAAEAKTALSETTQRLGRLDAAASVLKAQEANKTGMLGTAGAVLGGFAAGPVGAAVGGGLGAIAGTLANPATAGLRLAQIEALAQRIGALKAKTAEKTTSAVQTLLRPVERSSRKALAPSVATRLFGNDQAERRRSAQKMQQKLETFSAEPQRLAEALSYQTAPIGDAAPANAARAQMGAMKGMQFLQSKIPQSLSTPYVLQPQLNKVQWTPEQVEKFARYASAVADPDSVLDDMKRGHLSPEHVEALSEVYPQKLQDIRDKALEEVAKHGEEIPYSSTLQLGLLLGIETHPTLSPKFLYTMGQVYKATGAQAQQKTTPPSNTKPVNFNALASTPDRLSAGLGK